MLDIIKLTSNFYIPWKKGFSLSKPERVQEQSGRKRHLVPETLTKQPTEALKVALLPWWRFVCNQMCYSGSSLMYIHSPSLRFYGNPQEDRAKREAAVQEQEVKTDCMNTAGHS